MFVVLTHTSDFIVYFVRALREALSNINTLLINILEYCTDYTFTLEVRGQ